MPKTSLRVYVDPADVPGVDAAAREAGLSRSTWAKRVIMAALGRRQEGPALPSESPRAAPQLPAAWIQDSGAGIVLLVADGIGDAPEMYNDGVTPLMAAKTPNLDYLAQRGVLGLTVPIATGITAGSVTGHLALFGYDPTTIRIGRGPIDALGAGVDLLPGDVVLRGNFAVVQDGVVVDRRAGRLSDAEAKRHSQFLNIILREITEVDARIFPTAGHRFVLRLRGPGLDPRITDTDPMHEGEVIRASEPLATDAKQTALLVNAISGIAHFTGNAPNAILLRGAGTLPRLASFPEHYRMPAHAYALHPTYLGVTRACGMEVHPPDGYNLTVSDAAMRRHSNEFVYLHFKAPDAAGEDGNFDAKVKAIEKMDEELRQFIAIPEFGNVLVITGDHSTPVAMKSHSWHPVPLLIASKWTVEREVTRRFTEIACAAGELGRVQATDVMALALAHAGRLRKVDT